MDIRHLRYFLVLAEELHFGHAARRLLISQPPLSVSIRQLEESIGARLFERSHQQVRLTDAGQALIPAARALIAGMNTAMEQVRDISNGVTGHLRVGFVGALLYQGLPALLQRFQQQRPGLRLSLLELNTREQLSDLLHGGLDVGFVHHCQLPAGIAARRFSRDRIALCLPQQHPLAGQPKVGLTQLRGEHFVVFSRALSPFYYDRIQSLLLAASIDADARCEARHWLSVIALVAKGFGVALVPASLEHAAMAGVTFVQLDCAVTQSEGWCVWKKDDPRPLLAALTAMLPPHLAEDGERGQ
ncbi:LysR family transcriptional regulator [Erwinia sp. B116]|uniref:LysR family transcriptional regulator n=1 Tax=Erwinia sp. B116 TaxID=1561024 RepID=UPI000C762B99|nr:LysR family transcriptional regulator [Erwinia sp. B116]